ncbi:MAG: AbrB/MazE/SpoVT family DNA-binding domain-containing protein [bacterium]|nr:AbrB/MazE/SpoVT family DNA-binding domain-containing protein [bacterium]
MEVFQTKPKKWGNSLGVTIPKEIVDKEGLSPSKKVRVFIVLDKSMDEVRKSFGTLKLKIPTQKAMEEIDEGEFDD